MFIARQPPRPPLRSKERNATRLVLFKIPYAPSNGAGSSVGCGAINISLLRSENPGRFCYANFRNRTLGACPVLMSE
jgi:hypothetical protein